MEAEAGAGAVGELATRLYHSTASSVAGAGVYHSGPGVGAEVGADAGAGTVVKLATKLDRSIASSVSGAIVYHSGPGAGAGVRADVGAGAVDKLATKLYHLIASILPHVASIVYVVPEVAQTEDHESPVIDVVAGVARSKTTWHQ